MVTEVTRVNFMDEKRNAHCKAVHCCSVTCLSYPVDITDFILDLRILQR
jgi:hypothetical protein